MNSLVLFIFGLCFGSFINALVWRIRTKRPIANDRSECPNCHHKLAGHDLIPVLSWVILKGRCRYCKKPISAQYPLVELITAALFVLSYWNWEQLTSSVNYLQLAVWLLILVVAIALAVYDLKWMLLPNRLMASLAIAGGLFMVVSTIASQDWSILTNSLIAAFAASGFFYALFAFSAGRWMGGGDVKLVFIIGIILGVAKTLVALLIAFNSAAILSVILILSKKLGRKSLLPFGPFLIAGLIVAQLYGRAIVDWYLSFVGIA